MDTFKINTRRILLKIDQQR